MSSKTNCLLAKSLLISHLLLINFLLVQISGFTQGIVIQAPGWYPEGIAYNPGEDVFYVSSMREGSIGQLTMAGDFRPFITDEALISTVGLHFDVRNSILYACVSDVGVSVHSKAEDQNKIARLVAFGVPSGKRKFMLDLSTLAPDGNHFANDISIDSQGNLYITDSFQPHIIKVSGDGNYSVFASSAMWALEGFNLNGIAVIQDTLLLAAQTNTGALYRVSMAQPQKVQQIATPPIVGADGIIVVAPNQVAVISNGQNKIVILETSDNWQSATVVRSIPSTTAFPTTGVMLNGKLWVVNSKLNELFGGLQPWSETFEIQTIGW